MIGRNGPVDHFDLVRWARRQAHPDVLHTGHPNPETGETPAPRRLRRIEAHLLLLLATYADQDARAFPGIKLLAEDTGLTVKTRKKGGRESHECSQVTAALTALQELGLIWRRQAGRGRKATTELLFLPPEDAGGNLAPRTAGGQDSCPPENRGLAPRTAGGEVPGKNHHEEPGDAPRSRGGHRSSPTKRSGKRSPQPLSGALADVKAGQR